MTQVTFRDDMTVETVQVSGSERLIADAAWVSTGLNRGEEVAEDRIKGMLRRLFRDGHGTPFEYPEFIFYFEIPVFVDRQLVKYRLTTINGSSGRYSDLRPEFYQIKNVEPYVRPVIQVGKTMDYEFALGQPGHYEALDFVHRTTAESSWQNYEQLRQIGVAKEVARMHMPLTTYGSMYYKINLRNTLNFLSQRLELDPDVAAIPSHPQYEIARVAEQVAKRVEESFPNVWEAFVESGYRKL